MVTPEPPRCDWCRSTQDLTLIAENVNGTPAHACRPCWNSPALTLIRAVNAARRELNAQTPGSLERAEATAQAARRVLTRHVPPDMHLAPVEVTGQEVRVGDGVHLGGRTFIVLRRTAVTGGVKLRFLTGELLALHRHTRLTVMRPGRLPGEPSW